MITVYCHTKDCVLRQECGRYHSIADYSKHTYFFKPPYKLKGKKFSCDMFVGSAFKSIYNQLKNIVG